MLDTNNDAPIVKSTDDARAGITGHHVRQVLVTSLIAAILLLIVIAGYSLADQIHTDGIACRPASAARGLCLFRNHTLMTEIPETALRARQRYAAGDPVRGGRSLEKVVRILARK